MKITYLAMVACAALATGTSSADPIEFDSSLTLIQQQWAVANYRIADRNEQKRAFEAVAANAHQLSSEYPGRPEALIWEGIVLSSYAGAKGGLGALSLAKQSKALFEAALRIDPNALEGSAYTSLGVLYAKVPGFPLGFGDDDKARELLQKALALNANGIDPNYFYAEYLCERHRCAQALPYLERAAKAPPRSGREIADLGRQREISQLMAKAKS